MECSPDFWNECDFWKTSVRGIDPVVGWYGSSLKPKSSPSSPCKRQTELATLFRNGKKFGCWCMNTGDVIKSTCMEEEEPGPFGSGANFWSNQIRTRSIGCNLFDSNAWSRFLIVAFEANQFSLMDAIIFQFFFRGEHTVLIMRDKMTECK